MAIVHENCSTGSIQKKLASRKQAEQVKTSCQSALPYNNETAADFYLPSPNLVS